MRSPVHPVFCLSVNINQNKTLNQFRVDQLKEMYSNISYCHYCDQPMRNKPIDKSTR